MCKKEEDFGAIEGGRIREVRNTKEIKAMVE